MWSIYLPSPLEHLQVEDEKNKKLSALECVKQCPAKMRN